MKIVFVAVPYLETDQPLMAPAVLKSIAENHGHTSWGFDFNIDVCNELNRHDAETKSQLVDFLLNRKIQTKSLIKIIYQMLDQHVKAILLLDPEVVGLSLLTTQSQFYTTLLARQLKRRQPDIEIIIGGPGIKHELVTNNLSYCDELKKLGLVDHYIVGDGEQALIEYLKGNLDFPGIDSNQWRELTDLDQWPFPNYDDYDFTKYSKAGVRIPILDSRGCIRSCEFCDIIENWQHFRYRSAESLWKEIQHQISKHKISNFMFNNALTNGNMKVFNTLLDLMSEHNQNQPRSEQISWSGYFIVRPKAQHPESLWKKLQQTNAYIFLGVESAVETVRYRLGKPVSNEDVDWHLEMGQKYNVPMVLLMMVAYPLETVEDYEFTKQWYKDRLHYAQNSVVGVMLNYTTILPATALSRKAKEYQIKISSADTLYSAWYNKQLKISNETKINYMQNLVEICRPFNQNAIIAELVASQLVFASSVIPKYAHEVEHEV